MHERTIDAAAPMPGRYEPQSAEYEGDGDGFKESEGVMIAGAGLRSTHPLAREYLQRYCSRRHVQKKHARVCSLCLIDIPAAVP